jgi:hypothetical protein
VTGRCAVRVHREVQLAVGFAGQQLGVGLRVVAEDDADAAGVGVGNRPSATVRRAPANKCVCVAYSATGSLIPPTLGEHVVLHCRRSSPPD